MDWHKKILLAVTATVSTLVFSIIMASQTGYSKTTEERIVSTVENTINTIIYTKDPRTNLCFAVFNANYSYRNSTNVPCTTEVLAEIAKNHEGK